MPEAPGMGCVEGGPAFQETADPGRGGSLIREQTVHFPHAPGGAPAPLQAQVRVSETPQQEENGNALRGQGHEVNPACGEGGVDGQDAGVAEKEAVQDGLPTVHVAADQTPDMPVMSGQFAKGPHGPHRRTCLADRDLRAGVGQQEMGGLHAALRSAVAQTDFGQDVAAEAHRDRGLVNPRHGLAVVGHGAPPAPGLAAKAVEGRAQLPPGGLARKGAGKRGRSGAGGKIVRHVCGLSFRRSWLSARHGTRRPRR
jgi:hypothetical protein